VAWTWAPRLLATQHRILQYNAVTLPCLGCAPSAQPVATFNDLVLASFHLPLIGLARVGVWLKLDSHNEKKHAAHRLQRGLISGYNSHGVIVRRNHATCTLYPCPVLAGALLSALHKKTFRQTHEQRTTFERLKS
jgi:hypothetical protein